MFPFFVRLERDTCFINSSGDKHDEKNHRQRTLGRPCLDRHGFRSSTHQGRYGTHARVLRGIGVLIVSPSVHADTVAWACQTGYERTGIGAGTTHTAADLYRFVPKEPCFRRELLSVRHVSPLILDGVLRPMASDGQVCRRVIPASGAVWHFMQSICI